MEKFVRQQNVQHFCRLLRSITDNAKKQTVELLLAEEQQKQQDAGDVIGLGMVADVDWHSLRPLLG